jgi:hypothetical protein
MTQWKPETKYKICFKNGIPDTILNHYPTSPVWKTLCMPFKEDNEFFSLQDNNPITALMYIKSDWDLLKMIAHEIFFNNNEFKLKEVK